MATHSSILAWKIPSTEEPGGLQSMGVAKNWTSMHGGPVVRTLFLLLRARVRELRFCKP